MATGTYPGEPTPPPRQVRPPGGQLAASLDYEGYIAEHLDRTRAQVRLVDIASSVVTLIIGALGFLLVLAMVDHWLFPLGFWLRLLSLSLLLGGAGWWIWSRLVPLVIRRINPVYAAYAIERSTPSLKNSLINMLLLRAHRGTVHDVVYKAVEERAATDLSHVQIDSAIDRKHLIHLGYVLAGLLVVFITYKLLSPKDPLQSVARVIAPWAEIDRPSRVDIDEVTPGDVDVFYGDKLTVSALVRGARAGEKVKLFYSTADGQAIDQEVALTADASGIKYSAELSPSAAGITQSLQYRLAAGDAETRWYNVQVLPAPTILVHQAKLDFPRYTGRAPEALPHGDLSAIEGTRVTLLARANQPIQSAFLEFDPLRAASSGDSPVLLHIEKIDGQECEVSFYLRLKEDRRTPEFGSYAIRFKTPDGHRNREPIVHSIDVKPDIAPQVEILAPKQEAQVPQNGRLNIEVRAVDHDFALRRLRLLGTSAEKEVLDFTLFESPDGRRGQVMEKFEFVPQSLGLVEGDVVEYWAVAEDDRTAVRTEAHEPNVTRSKPNFRIEITAPVAGEPGKAPHEKPKPDEAGGENSQPQNGGSEANSPQNSGGEKGAEGSSKNKEQPPEEGTGGESGEGGTSGGSGSASQGGEKSKDKQQGEGGASGSESSDSSSSDAQESGGEGGTGGQPSDKQSPSEGNSGSGGQSGGKNSGQHSENAEGSSEPLPADGSRDGDVIERIQQHQKERSEKGQSGNSGSPSGGENANQEQQTGDGAGQEEGAGEQPMGEQGNAGGQQQSGSSGQQEGNESGAQNSGQNSQQGSGSQGGEKPQGSAGDNASQGSGAGEKSQKPEGNAGENSQGGTAGQQGNKPEGSAGNQSQGGGASGEQGQKPEQGGESSKGQQGGGEKSQENKQQGGGEKSGEQAGGGQQQSEPKNGGSGDQQGGQPQGGQKQGDEQAGGQSGQQENSGGGMGDNDKSGAGQKGQEGGSPMSQAENPKQGKQDKQGGGGQGGEQNQGKSPAGSQKSSDSQGESGGDRKGGGEQGGGQSSKQKGQDSAGSSSSGEQGDGAAQEPGAGQNSNQAGGSQVADKPTGKSGDQTGEGSQKGNAKEGSESGKDGSSKPGESSGGKTPGAGSRPQEGQTGDEPGKKPSSTPGEGQGTIPTGGGKPADNRPSDKPFAGKDPPTEKANLEYAQKATDMVLDYLKNQKDKPDRELLDKLGWTKDDLAQFVDRWERMQQAAKKSGADGAEAKRKLDDSLRSLGLRPQDNQFRTSTPTTAKTPGTRDTGSRTQPPKEYAEQYRAFSKFIEPAKE